MKGLGLKIGIVIPLVLAGIIGIWCLTSNIKYDNQHQELVADVDDQERKIESNYDKMSKVILQAAQVNQKYAKDFRGVVKDAMTGRYGADGSKAMFQWIQENSGQLSDATYTKLMTVIEAQRTGFDREQRKLSQLAAADKKLFTKWPGTWFTSGEPVEVMIISSTKAKEVMKTGIDDDVDLFKNE